MEVQFQDRLVLLIEFLAYPFLHVGENLTEVFTDKDGDDGGGRFVCAETEVVAGAGDGSTENIGVVVNRLDGVDKEGQEHQVGLRRFAGSQEVDTGVGGPAPVVV